MSQENWPFENAISGLAVRDEIEREECECDARLDEEHAEECELTTQLPRDGGLAAKTCSSSRASRSVTGTRAPGAWHGSCSQRRTETETPTQAPSDRGSLGRVSRPTWPLQKLNRSRHDMPMEAPTPARLIVPLDTSALAETVLPWAGLVARDHGMELHLVSVWDRAEPILGLTSATTDANVEELDRYLKTTTASIQRYGVKGTSEACAGDTATEIKRIAKEREGSMVMLCSHGHGGYRESYMGSIADRLVRSVGVPVLVIPATA